MSKILFILSRYDFIRGFAPVIKRLQEQHEFGLEPVIIIPVQINTTAAIRFSEEYNLPYMKVDFVPYALKKNEEISDFIEFIITNIKSIPAYSYTKIKVNKLFNKLKPAFIVTATEGYYADRFFLQEAKKRGIPSLCLFSVIMTEGAQAPKKIKTEGKLLYPLKILYRVYKKLVCLGFPMRDMPVPSRGDATKIAVWGDYQKEVFMDDGGLSEKIAITGSPAHDMIYQRRLRPSHETKTKIYRLLDIEKDKGIILFTSQPFYRDNVCTSEEQKRLTEYIIDSVSKFDRYVLVIKLHPRESREDYAYLNGHPLKHRFRLVGDTDPDLYDLIENSQILMTQSSTTGLDGMLFGKEVITVDMLDLGDPLGYVKSGAAIGVYKEEDLVPAIKDALYNEEVRERLAEARKKFVYERAYKQDGQASKRVVDLIMQMIEESKMENDHEK